MALTVTVVATYPRANRRAVVADLTFDSTYPAGGEALLPATLGLTTVETAELEVARFSATESLIARYDRTNSKVLLYETAAAVATPFDEEATADQSGTTVRGTFVGF